MTIRIGRSHVVYRLDRANPFMATLPNGERATVETHDCRTGTITATSTVDDLRETRYINPVTGPIEIPGTEPGDVLAVDIHAVRVADHGLMITRPGTTVFDRVAEPALRMTGTDDERVGVGPLSVEPRPMIGFIGLTPAEEMPITLVGGAYGGNLDTALLTTGARLYLPVAVAGAGLHVGDLHAAMGDGEVFLTGVEVAGEVDLTVRRLAARDLGGRALPTPLLETAELIVPIATGATLDEAARAALLAAMSFLTEWVGLSVIDAGFFMSAGCDLRVSQFLPGFSIHCRVEIPKAPLARRGLPYPILDLPLDRNDLA